MTVCRKAHCGENAIESALLSEGDRGWCEWHLIEVQAVRDQANLDWAAARPKHQPRGRVRQQRLKKPPT